MQNGATRPVFSLLSAMRSGRSDSSCERVACVVVDSGLVVNCPTGS